jgi:hypothetical protein
VPSRFANSGMMACVLKRFVTVAVADDATRPVSPRLARCWIARAMLLAA